MATIKISNVVSTAYLKSARPINLHALAVIEYGKYNPDIFAACQVRLAEPRTTLLVFSTGKVVCTGAKSRLATVLAIQVLMWKIKARLNPDIYIQSIDVQNIVAAATLSYPCRLREVASSNNATRQESEAFLQR